MLTTMWSKLTECLHRRPQLLVLILTCLLVLSFYAILEKKIEFPSPFPVNQYSLEGEMRESGTSGIKIGARKSHSRVWITKKPLLPDCTDIKDGYLVWNRKCHIISKNPMDESVRRLVKKEKFTDCRSGPLMSYISRDSTNGSIYIAINAKVAAIHKSITCCWAPITREVPARPPKDKWDTKISQGKCEDFKERVWVPQNVEIAMISCRQGKSRVYENVHAIVNPTKVQKRLDQVRSMGNGSELQKTSRKLSVLILGIDSVSRLNFKRSMPKTDLFLRETNWFSLDGYNKMGDNTFPNLMAVLTGQNITTSYHKCEPNTAFGLDRCPMVWYNFRNANYVTAYGEDVSYMSSFNYHKVGFVDPPTDYYLRPYVIASEKLGVRKKSVDNTDYCSGPESSVDRIFNYALDFAKTFLEMPYFGFFWTNAATHNYLNGASSMDERMLEMFQKMKREGIFNDTMIIFLSDHGMRWGQIRDTFVGWYEERLPFIYIRLPEWFREENPQSVQALRLNQRRLTSPYDLYETLRDVLTRAGGKAGSSSGCMTCQTLLRPVPIERGCEDVGVTPHWCTCTAFETTSIRDKIALKGTEKFLEHVENRIKHYKDKRGKRLCSKLKLKKIHRIDRIMNVRHGENSANFTLGGYFYLIEVVPGGAKYEFTLRYREGDDFTVSDDEISRTNLYGSSSRCLNHGFKIYCHCAR